MIMKKYCVYLKETSCGFAEVEANDEDEAKGKAREAWSNGFANMPGNVDCEILSVDEC